MEVLHQETLGVADLEVEAEITTLQEQVLQAKATMELLQLLEWEEVAAEPEVLG